MSPDGSWWQRTTIYQIYPRSFADSNGDGVGDLRGIISRLDHVQDLGFETVWISPFFASPQCDWGYDVSDYYAVAPEYGDRQDIEDLIEAVHARGMRILFDLVMNHTSIQHPWFRQSRSRRDHPRRDWYIWEDGRGGRPPNNWRAIPGGSGWHYDPPTGQWYYASFLPCQPDLNYRHPPVKQAMLDVVRHWFDAGVDGFRLDIFHAIYLDEAFRDNPFSWSLVPTEEHTAGFFQRWEHTLHQPETFGLARELRTIADEYGPEKLLLGEVFGSDDTLKEYLGRQLDGLNLVFSWGVTEAGADVSTLRQVIRHQEECFPPPYTPVYVLGNHDRERVLSRVGGDVRLAQLLALLQFTARGVPVTYYGEEIGMADGGFSPRGAKDPLGRRYGWVPGFLLDLLGLYVNRDGCRTPMQWDGTPHAGFCPPEVTPWLPVHDEYPSVNVDRELAAEDSILNSYRALLRLRREEPALVEGPLHVIDGPEVGRHLLAFRREHGRRRVLVVINFGSVQARFQGSMTGEEVLFGVGRVELEGGAVSLAPFSGGVISLGSLE